MKVLGEGMKSPSKAPLSTAANKIEISNWKQISRHLKEAEKIIEVIKQPKECPHSQARNTLNVAALSKLMQQ